MLSDIQPVLKRYIKSQPPAEQERLETLLEQFDSLPSLVREELEDCLAPNDDAPLAIEEDDDDGASGKYANPLLASTLMVGVPNRVKFPVIFCYGEVDGSQLVRATKQCQKRFHTLKKTRPASQTHQDMAIMVYAYHWLCVSIRFYYDESKHPDVFVFNSSGIRSYEGELTVRYPRRDVYNALDKKANVYTNLERTQFDSISCFVFCTEFLFNYARAERYLDNAFFEIIKAAPFFVMDDYHFVSCRLPAYFRRSTQSFDDRAGVFRRDAPKETGPVSKRGESFTESVARYTKTVKLRLDDDSSVDSDSDLETTSVEDGADSLIIKRTNHRIEIKKLRWWFKALALAIDEELTELPAPVTEIEFKLRTQLIILIQSIAETPDLAAEKKAKLLAFIGELNTPVPINKAKLTALFQYVLATPSSLSHIANDANLCRLVFMSLDDFLSKPLLNTIRIEVAKRLSLGDEDMAQLLNHELTKQRSNYVSLIINRINLAVIDSSVCSRMLVSVLKARGLPTATKLAFLKSCVTVSRQANYAEVYTIVAILGRDNLFKEMSSADLRLLTPLFQQHVEHDPDTGTTSSTLMKCLLSMSSTDWLLIQRLLLLDLKLPAGEVGAIASSEKTPAHARLVLGLMHHCANVSTSASAASEKIDIKAQAPGQLESAAALGFASPAALYEKPLTLLYLTEAHLLLETYFTCRRDGHAFPMQLKPTVPDIISVVRLELSATAPKHTRGLSSLIGALPITSQRAVCNAIPTKLHAKAQRLRLWSESLTRTATKKRDHVLVDTLATDAPTHTKLARRAGQRRHQRSATTRPPQIHMAREGSGRARITGHPSRTLATAATPSITEAVLLVSPIIKPPANRKETDSRPNRATSRRRA